jgi:hypothetical protein
MIEAEELRSILKYVPETGEFFWSKHLFRSNAQAGDKAGCLHGGGYIAIQIKRRRYYAHRLAWLYMYGEWPSSEIDHINRIKNDNRIENLRVVTRSENMKNVGLRKLNTSGYNNVSFSKTKNKFRAYTRVSEKYKHIGYYDTAYEAYLATSCPKLKDD